MFFMGIDVGTQSFKATVMDENRNIVYWNKLEYDTEFSNYQTKNGVYYDEVTKEARVPLFMYVEALEKILDDMDRDMIQQVKCISGSAQMHGAAFWKENNQLLRDKKGKISEILTADEMFVTPYGTNWMDSSTSEECQYLETIVGGAQEMANITGSRACERFTGPQIIKFKNNHPNEYQSCERISLISSFMATLLLGEYAPIDFADACGMNLMDIETKAWNKSLVQACGPNLEVKLGKCVPSNSTLGNIHQYYQDQYGFSKDCQIVAMSGDNPNTAAGLGIHAPGDLLVSLGTSDTVMAISKQPTPGLVGHVFTNTLDKDASILMVCFKNGSLCREYFRDFHGISGWPAFNECLKKTQPGNNGNIGYYYLQSEIAPNVPSGIHRYNMNDIQVDTFDATVECRAVVESQFMSMRMHANAMSMPAPTKIVATGGGSSSFQILQILSNIFNCPVHTANTTDAASSGAAYRAYMSYNTKVSRASSKVEPPTQLEKACSPMPESAKIYSSLLHRYQNNLVKVIANTKTEYVKQKPIYLDYNATTPIDPKVANEMQLYLKDAFGNPSSSHVYGEQPKQGIKYAKDCIGNVINCEPNEVLLLSGGTESINHVIKGAAMAAQRKSKGYKNHIITSAVEHVAVLETCRYLKECMNFEVTYLPVDAHGQVHVNDVKNAITSNTFMVTIMHSNNEVGTLQPISEITQMIKGIDKEILVHTDASQSIGKVNVCVKALGIDYLTIAGHKLYAPKGIGALYIRNGTPQLEKFMHGGNQENGLRAGTENVMLAAGLGKAFEILQLSDTEKLLRLRTMLLCKIQENCSVLYKVHGHPSKFLPNTLSIGFKDIAASSILQEIQSTVAASGGSACHSDKTTCSYVLQAMGVDLAYALGTVRLSVGRMSTEDQILRAGDAIASAVNKLSKLATQSISKTSGTFKKYYEDAFMFTCEATVLQADMDIQPPESASTHVITDLTIFHPQGGGQPWDTGKITSQNAEFSVTSVRVASDRKTILHFGDYVGTEKFLPGDKVTMIIDAERRVLHAKLHSGGHLVDRAMTAAGYEFPSSKGNHAPELCFVEYVGKLSADEKLQFCSILNEKIRDLVEQDIRTYSKVGEASTVQEACGTNFDLSHLPKDAEIRVVSIGGLYCPCGGTHVDRTSQLKGIEVEKVKCKSGKVKVYYNLHTDD